MSENTTVSSAGGPNDRQARLRSAEWPGGVGPTVPIVAAESRPRQAAEPSEARAIRLDAESRDEMPLDVIWHRLASGRWRVVDQFTTEDRHYLVVKSQKPPHKQPEVELLLRTLLGERQKVVALDTELSPSTITTRLSSSLASMGFPPRPARAPIFLVATAAVAAGRIGTPAARLTHAPTPDGDFVILSTTRLDAHLRLLLTPAEWLVARLLVDGLSHREIAARRGSTTRTVANQVASIFRKLDVSGRRELLLRAVTGHGEASACGPTASADRRKCVGLSTSP